MRKTLQYLMLIVIAALSTVITLAQNNTRIELGQPVTGTITNEKPVDSYTLAGQAGQTLTISMNAVEQGLDSYVQVIAPDGQEFYNDDSASSLNSMLVLTLPVSGDYTINATRCCGGSPSGSTGNYELRVSTLELLALTVGQPITVELNDNQPYLFASLSNLSQDAVSLYANRTAGDANLVVEVRDSNGSVVNGASYINNGITSIDPLVTNNATTLAFYRQSNTGQVAGTSITATVTLSAIESTRINLGDTVTGELNDNNPSDHYVFSATPDQILRLAGAHTEGSFGVGDIMEIFGDSPDSEQPFEVQIYGTQGYSMSGSSTAYGGPNPTNPPSFVLDPLQLAETGEYMLVIRRIDINGTGVMGTSHYSVTLDQTQTPVIQPGQPIVDGFEANQWESVYRLEGRAGQTIRITLSGESDDYGPQLNVQQPQQPMTQMGGGTAMPYGGDGGGGMVPNFYLSASSSVNAIITYEVTLPMDGIYLFRIGNSAYNAYNPNGGLNGTFRLLVENINN
jgi:hypothetical protein